MSQAFDPPPFSVACVVGLTGRKVSTDVVSSAELQQRSASLTEAADVFGVILAAAVARLSCFTQGPDASNGSRSS